MKKTCLITVLTASILLSACAYQTTDAPVETIVDSVSVESGVDGVGTDDVIKVDEGADGIDGDDARIDGDAAGVDDVVEVNDDTVNANSSDVAATITKESVSAPDKSSTETEEMAPEFQKPEKESENFADISTEITSEDINNFTYKIKQAVTSKDLEALADLCGYPVYVSLQDGQGIEINNRQAFLDLGSENIFADSLEETMKSIDPHALEVFGAGVVLGENANIIFNKIEGRLMITGINI